MALVKQKFNLENLLLEFYSFQHPITGEIWVDGVSIAKSLGYENYSDAIYKLVKNISFKSSWRDLMSNLCDLTIPLNLPQNWNKNTTMINEGGLNCLIMSSRLPNAQKYKEWVCGTVLPTIRKTGKYEIIKNIDENLEIEYLKLKSRYSNLNCDLIKTQSELNMEKMNKEHELNKLRLENEYRLKALKDENVNHLKFLKEENDKLKVIQLTTSQDSIFNGIFSQQQSNYAKSLKRKIDDVFETASISTDMSSVNLPGKDNVIALFKHSLNGKLKISRTQVDTLNTKRYSKIENSTIVHVNPIKRHTRHHKINASDFEWVLIKTPIHTSNSTKSWNLFRQKHALSFQYGVKFYNKPLTTFTFLDKEELIELYNKIINSKDFDESKWLFEDEQEFVSKCNFFINDNELSFYEKLQTFINDIENPFENDTLPDPPSYNSVMNEVKKFIGTLSEANVQSHDWFEIRKIQHEKGFLFDYFSKNQNNSIKH